MTWSNRVRQGGIALVIATLLFVAVFGYLAATFDYPDVLDRPATEVLPALLGLGTAGRAVWLVYGLIPLLLIPAGRGVEAAAARTDEPATGRIAKRLAVLSAVAMMAGLLRWPTLQWSLAEQWPSASPATRESIAQRFAAANLYLGNVIGEFAGELFLYGFFFAASLILVELPGRRWLAYVGFTASVLGWVAMLRNMTTAVAPIADLNNTVLPVWMLILGLAFATVREFREM